MTRTASVKVEGVDSRITVPITAGAKPHISDALYKKWQRIVDLAAKIINVPSGLIMRLEEKEIEVFIRSETEENPYECGEKADLGLGLYCETVVGRRRQLLVPNALTDSRWDSNPDIDLNMISYLGIPLLWPDGEVFGTFCVLDSKENEYSDEYIELLQNLKEIIENDLESVLRNAEAAKNLAQSELELRELRHRIKNEFNMLVSFIELYGFEEGADVSSSRIAAELKNRINAISHVHDLFLPSLSGTSLSLKEYSRTLCREIMKTVPADITVQLQGDPCPLSEKYLVTIGLLLNELIMNSVKHGLSGVDDPEIELDLLQSGNSITVRYQDNGTGNKRSTGSTGGFGTLIINALLDQIDAEVCEDSKDGYNMEFTFPVKPA
jgi:two-component sensor histidine kinase